MSVVKRFNELLDLDEIDVLIDEVDKSRHIILSDIPDSLPQGRSSFLIETSPYMKQDTELQIDFIDSEGSSIYTEPIADYLEGRARRVSVEVYDDTAPGIATLVIVGELIAVPDGNTIFSGAEQVPQRFQGAYNVRLTKQIVINPTAVNTQPIKFFGQPIINVTETRVGTMVRSEVTGSVTTSFFELEAVPTDENLLFKPYGVNLNPSQGLLSEGAPSSPAKQRSLKAYIESRKRKNRKGKRKNSVFKRSGLLSKTNSPPTFPYRIRPGSFNGEESFRFNTGFVGGEVHFHTSSLGNTFGSSSFYPQAALTEAGLLETPTFDTEKEQGIVNISASMYTASIVDLVSDRIIAVDKPFTNKNVNGEDIILPIFARGQIHYEAMPTASYAAANLVSYANVTLADMRTFSGDVYKVKVYVKSEGGFDDYKLLAEVPLEGKELLVDDASVGQGDRTGYFIEQGDIDNFWTVSGSVNGEASLGTPATNAAYNNNIMLDSVKLSGSLANPTHHLKFQLNDEYKFELIKGVDYNLSIDVIGSRSGSNYATLAFYISGSSMNRLDDLFYDEYADKEIVESSKYGKRLGTLTIKPEDDEVKDFETVTQTFTPDVTGDGVLQVRVLQGVWNIGDIAIGPAADTGFNPSLFQFKQEMPAELSHKRPDTFEFMAEFYDVNNNLSDTIAYKSGVQFTGTNMTITGEDNVLESNLFIGGDTTGSGMHLGGVTSTLPETGTSGAAGSGFMRSVGYMGFTSASSDPVSGSHGFMIFSGSVLPDSGDDYKGVGLELVGQSGSLKFRTNPSVFDVRADAFFVGKRTTQFISGSNQNVEISSSGFHVTPEGNVTASAILLGDKGGSQFLQFDDGQLTVRGNLSVDELFTPAIINGNPSNITNASSSITAGGFAKFTSASIAGFTVNPIAIHSANNNLVMSASGQITGSDVLFTGGKIAAFSLSDDAFSTDSFFISASATGNDFFISSSNFQVTADGELSGSQVTFTGGDIAGWTIGSETLTGGNLILSKDGSIKSSNYQSDVAGFIITAEENGYAEFENVRVRGTLATTTFEKESVNAVGGQLFVANSTALTGSAVLAAATTMSVVNSSGFESGEILVAKKVTNTGFNTEYIRVDSASLDGDLSKDEVHGRIYVTRSISGTASENSSSIGDPIGTAQDYEPGQVLVSSGKIGTGYIRLNANPNNQATPYIDIIERTGSGVYDVQLKARLGDLKGVAGTRNVPENFDGFGLMSEVAFLSGSNIKLEAPAFLLGDLNQNFVSGSNSNIEISSSRFHLSPNGDLKVGRTETSSSVSSYTTYVDSIIGTGNLYSYYSFDGSGAISSGATITDAQGNVNLTANLPGGDGGMNYDSTRRIGTTSLKTSLKSGQGTPFAFSDNSGTGTAISAWSVSLWFYQEDFSSDFEIIYAQANRYHGFGVHINDDDKICGFAYRASAGANDQTLVTHAAGYNENQWYHIALTFDSSTDDKLKLYVGGSLVAESALSTNLAANGLGATGQGAWSVTETHVLGNRGRVLIPEDNVDTFGTYSNDGQLSNIARIDDLRVYNDVLTASEISTLASTNPSGVTTTFSVPSIDFDNSNNDLKLNTKNFFLGSDTSAFVSGSNSNIEVSSSQFHLKASGQLTASSANFRGVTKVEDVAVADYFAFRNVVINSSNASQYLATQAFNNNGISQTGWILFLDGSLGGDRGMMVTLDNLVATTQVYPIIGIVPPSQNTPGTAPPSSGLGAGHRIIIETKGGDMFFVRNNGTTSDTNAVTILSGGYFFACDNDDPYFFGFSTTRQVDGGGTYRDCLEIDAGTRIEFARSNLDYKIQSISSIANIGLSSPAPTAQFNMKASYLQGDPLKALAPFAMIGGWNGDGTNGTGKGTLTLSANPSAMHDTSQLYIPAGSTFASCSISLQYADANFFHVGPVVGTDIAGNEQKYLGLGAMDNAPNDIDHGILVRMNGVHLNGTVQSNPLRNNHDFRVSAQASPTFGPLDGENIIHVDAERGVLGIGGSVGGTSYAGVLHVQADYDGYMATFTNDGNDAGRHGINIQAGKDNATGTTTYIRFADGDNTLRGSIQGSGATITYNAFTGAHPSYILKTESNTEDIYTSASGSLSGSVYPNGTVVSMVSSSFDERQSNQPLHWTVSSSIHQDKRVFGVYTYAYSWGVSGSRDDGTIDELEKETRYQHIITAVGDGVILASNQNGNIEIGDYLTTASGSGGYACKQNDDLLHNYTVAKATENVDWSNVSGSVKLIACTYHCG